MLSLMLFISFSTWAASSEVKAILSLKPGAKISKDQKLSGNEYEIKTEKDLIHSVQINFLLPEKPDQFISAGTSGHCLVQPPKGHIPLNRVFFFNQKTKTRYEMNPEGLVISILIQDMPEAGTHRVCQFKDVQKIEIKNEKLKKVK